jgi:hypothetical protein
MGVGEMGINRINIVGGTINNTRVCWMKTPQSTREGADHHQPSDTIIIFSRMACTLSEGGEGGAEKSTLCTLVKMMDDP